MSLVNASTANFDGNDLAANVPGLTVLATNPYKPPQRSLTINQLARSNKAKTNSGFYSKKPVNVRIGITGATRAIVEQSFDTLMSLLQGIEKDLLLQQSGALRKYTVTYQDFVISAEGGSYLEGTLVFETSDHFGYDSAATLLTQVSGYTSAQKTTQITIGGSAQWQAPTITITFTAVVSASGTLIIANDATGQNCSITRAWAAGDVVELDAVNQTVKINGTEVAFTGAIPEWSKGVGYISVSDNFTSRTYSMTMRYYRRWA